MGENEAEYDRVTQASLNGLYVKAQELDRCHNQEGAPDTRPPGASGCAGAPGQEADRTAHASDATSHASPSASAR